MTHLQLAVGATAKLDADRPSPQPSPKGRGRKTFLKFVSVRTRALFRTSYKTAR